MKAREVSVYRILTPGKRKLNYHSQDSALYLDVLIFINVAGFIIHYQQFL